jgi:hypothetical protein
MLELLGLWEKRGGANIRHLDPDRLDVSKFSRLLDTYGGEKFARADVREHAINLNSGHPPELDEFHRCGIESKDDLVRMFASSFFFGCEADDPLVGLAYDGRTTGSGHVLRPLFGSDVGHWDVQDMRGVLPEAFELVDESILDADQFRAFSCDNAIRLHTRINPSFFEGTAVASYVQELIKN